MYNTQKYFPVNWTDGMKINKEVFTAQENAIQDLCVHASALALTPLRYGVLPSDRNSEENFKVHAAVDNQMTLQVSILSCNAVTRGGVAINIPAAGMPKGTDSTASVVLRFPSNPSNGVYWIVLLSNPFKLVPFGTPDIGEDPPRIPYVMPEYKLEVVPDDQYVQFVNHPHALFVGKVNVSGTGIVVDEEYIPPCFSVSAHPALIDLYGELGAFYSVLERHCCEIVQKIYGRGQKNELSELVLFLCDRVMLFLSPAVTDTKWLHYHEPPVFLFSTVATLSRVIKNTIDLRIGLGKDELLNYLSEWCNLRSGELETIFTDVAMLRYDNNDISQCIQPIARFVKVIGKLFETLSTLEFIGKKKESGIFIKEDENRQSVSQRTRPRFFS
ncbi:MAG: hypothetical protein QM610_10105 [Chitinophagaceae bacterium]